MTLSTSHGNTVIVLTLVFALVMSIMPIPEVVSSYRIQVLPLVLIYWWLAIPERIGIFVAVICGILLDILTGTLLGQHAMALSVIAFITLKTYKRVRVFPLWQQAIFVVILLLLDRMLLHWVDGSIGRPAKDQAYWIAPLLGGLVWPWVYIILRDLRRRFKVR